MFFKTYYLGCLAHASYLIGGANGEAAVVDPRRDVEEYIADAESAGLRIRHVVETHLHADFVSGHLELARRCDATIHMGAAAGATFPHHAVRDGDTIPLGDVTLRFLATPGHTPESITVVAEPSTPGEPIRLFTGDTLFIGDVGRPDLAGGRGFTPQEMARQMYRSLADKILPLPDSAEVWPAHGAGSSCGKALSDERSTTLARQKAENPALRLVEAGDEEGFVRYATDGLGTAPTYFSFDAQKNREGAASIADILAEAKPLDAPTVESMIEDGVIVLDTRTVADFGAGHIPGSLHIQLDGKFAPWVGTLIAPEQTLIVVAYPNKRPEAVTRLARIGYERIPGWLEGGMAAWKRANGEVEVTEQLGPTTLRCQLAKGVPTVLDVRTPGEWDAGHIDGAIHIPLNQLADRVGEVPAGPVAVICGTGYRSSIACSVLQRSGRRDVANVTGGWEAWEKAQC
jgi:hydroxyacylglutathione hydrolase